MSINVIDRPKLSKAEMAMMADVNAHAASQITRQVIKYGSNEPIPSFLQAATLNTTVSGELAKAVERQMNAANRMAARFRENPRISRREVVAAVHSEGGAFAKSTIAKADLDVGTLTNFSQITGGQSLGYVSLDTKMARGTVRPNSFTLYQSLPKSAAYQVVDYWAYASATGGPAVGSAFADYSSVGTGTLNTSAGQYALKYITLKLALDGRAITTALAAQNSFVDVTEQENTNAALSVMETINWANYWGNPNTYANQFQGIAGVIPSTNIFDFQDFYTATGQAAGWSNEQTLFNLIYEAAASVTSYRQYGHITHAFMSPTAMGSLQTLVTGVLNNVVNELTTKQGTTPIIVNGDFQGMRTAFGNIQFPIDIFITARDKPVSAIVFENGSTNATTTGPTPPTSVTVTALTAQTGSAWTSAYAASSGIYTYAVGSTDASMNESVLTYSATVSGIAAGGGYELTITPAANDMVAFRVFRSGLGYTQTSGTANPGAFRYIADVVANGTNPVTFTDLNTHIPGSETIFLLDMDEEDMAIDYRWLLPLSKIELFAQNLYMPWAVATIGSIRVKVPKFHGLINNYVPSSPSWNPLSING